jgi:hypothetical protein
LLPFLPNGCTEILSFALILWESPLAAAAFAAQARIDAQAESFDRNYSVPEAMDAPLLESALPVRTDKQLGLQS